MSKHLKEVEDRLTGWLWGLFTGTIAFIKFILTEMWNAFVFHHNEKALQQILGTEVQQPFVSAHNTQDIIIRVALQLTNETLARPRGGLAQFIAGVGEQNPDSVSVTVLTATFDFSDKAIREIRDKRLDQYALINYDPINEHHLKRHCRMHGVPYSADVPKHKVALLVSDALDAPRQRLVFRTYADGADAVRHVKAALEKLKHICEHGADIPVAETYQT